MKRALLLLLIFPVLAVMGRDHARHDHPGMKRIPSGIYRPFLQANGGSKLERVKSFYLDIHAVTNNDFLQFVRANPQWARSKVSRLFADQHYLRQWAGDFEIGDPRIRNSPVSYVSWFAASAYAKWKGKRLPTEREWEYAAAMPPVGMKKSIKLSAMILEWYDRPTPGILPSVQSTYCNSLGIYDLHGLIWEWVEDFNRVSVNGFSCAAGVLSSADKENYAAFMRYAFRGGLQAAYTVGSLGFRCACDDGQ